MGQPFLSALYPLLLLSNGESDVLLLTDILLNHLGVTVHVHEFVKSIILYNVPSLL